MKFRLQRARSFSIADNCSRIPSIEATTRSRPSFRLLYLSFSRAKISSREKISSCPSLCRTRASTEGIFTIVSSNSALAPSKSPREAPSAERELQKDLKKGQNLFTVSIGGHSPARLFGKLFSIPTSPWHSFPGPPCGPTPVSATVWGGISQPEGWGVIPFLFLDWMTSSLVRFFSRQATFSTKWRAKSETEEQVILQFLQLQCLIKAEGSTSFMAEKEKR